MKSTYIIFPEANQIDVRVEDVAAPGEGEILCQAVTSLISTGTETFCLRGIFDADTNWAHWVQYPFRPGYSMTARVVGVGAGVTGFREGDRVSAWTPHRQYFALKAEQALPVPDGISDEDAPGLPWRPRPSLPCVARSSSSARAWAW